MNKNDTFSNMGYKEDIDLLCALGLPFFLTESARTQEGAVLTEPLVVSDIKNAQSASLRNSSPLLIRYAHEDPDKMGHFVCNWGPKSSRLWNKNTHFSTFLWLRKKFNIDPAESSQPLVNSQDINQIEAIYKSLGQGVRAIVSKNLKEEHRKGKHKVIRAMSAAQLLWKESLESAIQNE